MRRIRRTVDTAAAASKGRVVWPFKERSMWPEDEGFIYKNWIAMLRYHPLWREMDFRSFAPRQRAVIDEILSRPEVKVRVAVQDKVGEPKFGWLCYEWRGPVFLLHFVYMREHYRQKLITTRMLQRAGVELGVTPVVATAWTKAISYHVDRWNIEFDPFHAWKDGLNAHHKDLVQEPDHGPNETVLQRVRPPVYAGSPERAG